MSLLILFFLGVLGYALGIIGFFRAGAALREMKRLRLTLTHYVGQQSGEAAVPRARVPTAERTPEPSIKPLDADEQPVKPVGSDPGRVASADTPTPLEPKRPSVPHKASSGGDIESVLALRWAVWLGALALLFAGIFLIRYAAEHSVLGPAGRCCAAATLGAALLAGAEWLRRRGMPHLADRFGADQAPAGLAAGGIAVLFAASYGAGPFYDLLPPLAAFAAMSASSVLGLLAALRYGPLTAAVGIVGAFAAPALVPTEHPSLVGLFTYLGLLTAGAHAVVRRTAWTWLGWAVTGAGAAWVFTVSFDPDLSGIWAAAVFVPLSAWLGLLLPAVALDIKVGRRLAWGQFATIAAAGVVLDSQASDVLTHAALFALSAVAAWKGIREPRLDRLPWLAAVCGLSSLWFWDGSGHRTLLSAWGESNVSPALQGPEALLAAALVFALAHAALGLWRQTRPPNPAHWAALVATTPALTLAVCYAKVGQFEADPRWGFAGLLLTALLTATAAEARRRSGPVLAGVHAAGAVAALALAIATTAHDQWATTALSLMLPGLAWVDAKAGIPALRTVATVLAIAAFALLSAWFPYDLLFGQRTIADHAVVTLAIPAASFALAARMFRRGRDNRLVVLLEAGAVAAATLFVTVEVRLWFGQGSLVAPFGFDEGVTLMLTAAAQAAAYDRAARRTGRTSVRTARSVLACVAAVLAVVLLLADPVVTGVSANAWSLAGAYLVPGGIAALLARQDRAAPLRIPLTAFAVAAGFSWITAQVRLLFQPESLSVFVAPPTEAEVWIWSGAWLTYGLAIMAVGVSLGQRAVRLTALALIGMVCLKVFLVDTAELTGLWRVASFLGLGLALIGLGSAHRRFVLPEPGRGSG